MSNFYQLHADLRSFRFQLQATWSQKTRQWRQMTDLKSLITGRISEGIERLKTFGNRLHQNYLYKHCLILRRVLVILDLVPGMLSGLTGKGE